MANEFKIKKGLIVTGASGGTVVDIQGSQGQLFSVTDNLSGSIFAVSDISGVPILDVNSSGLSTFDGLVSGITPVNAANFVTKAYVDGSGGGTGPFLPLAGGTLTGALTGTSATFTQTVSAPTFTSGNISIGANAINNSSSTLYLQYYNPSQSVDFNNGKVNFNSLGNATFAGTIQSDDITIVDGSNDVNLYLANTSYGLQLDVSSGNMFFRTNGATRLTIANSGAATFSSTVSGTTATFTTFSGDLNGTINTATLATTQVDSVDNDTVATTAYVNNKIQLIPAGLAFEGTWDARTVAEGGAGTPPSASPLNGQFWIVSIDGSQNLSGITDWKVGDWAIYVDNGAGTDGWQKVDNSSVLDGFGTGGTVTGWAGSGTSNTLTNSPITFSGNNTSFPDDATFDTNIILEGNIYHKNDTNTYFGFNPGASEDDTIIFNTAGSERMRIDSSGQTTMTHTSGNTLTLKKPTGAALNWNDSTQVRAGIHGLNGADGMQFLTGSAQTQRMRINSQGQTWLGGYFTGADIANGNTSYLNNLNAGAFSVLHRNGGDAYVHFNTYYNSSNNYIAKYAGVAYMLLANCTANDGFRISKAPSVAVGATQSFSQVMTIGYGANDYVGIGDTAPTEKLTVTGGKVRINKQDEALTINAVSDNGSYINFTNSVTPYAYIGAANQIIVAGAATQLGLRSQSDMLFSTGGSTEKMRITNLGGISFGSTGTAYGTSGQILKSNGNASPTWIDGSAIPGVPAGSGTLNTVAMWTPDGDTLGNSPITISGSDIISSGRGVIENTTALTTGVVDSLLIKNLSSGTPITNGFGTAIAFYLENTVYSAVNEVGKIAIIQTNTINIDNKMVFSVKDNNILAERLTLTGQEAVFTGNVGIGMTSPIAPLQVLTTAVSGIDLTNISRTADNLVRFTNPEYSTNASMGLLLRVFPDSDARQGAGLLMTGGSDNAASNLSLFVSKDDGTSSNVSQSYSVLHAVGNTGRIGIGTTSPDSTLTLGNATDNVAELRVLRSNALSTNYAFINTVGGTAQIGGSADTRILSVAATANLLFNTNGVDRLRLVYDGQFWLKLNATTSGYEGAISNDNDKLRIFGSRFGGTGKYVSIWSDGANENARFYPTNTVFYKNVGINATNPNSRLDVRRAGSGVALELHQTSGSANDYVDLKMVAGNTNAGTFGTILRHKRDGSGGGDFSILTNPTLTGTPTEKLTVKSNGNVGIGTTTPLAKLDIQGTQGQLFSVTDDLSGSIFAVADISGVPIFDVNSSGVSYFDGNVGIGTASPGAKLHVLQPGNGTSNLIITEDNARKIKIGRDSIQCTDLSDSGTNLYLNQGGGNVSIPNSGLVVGATGITYKFEVHSGATNVTSMFKSADNQAWISIQDDDSGTYGALIGTDSDEGENFVVANNSVTKMLSITNSGSVKFHNYNSSNQTGTPTYLLGTDASGNVVKTNTIPGSAAGPYLPLAGGTMTGTITMDSANIDIKSSLGVVGTILSSSNSLTLNARYTGDMIFQSGGAEKMRIANGGNVGIGTTLPDYKLDVAGSVGIDDYIYHNGDADTYFGFNTINNFRVQSGGNLSISANTGEVSLYNAGVARFQTTTTGVAATGGNKGAPGYSFIGDLDTGMFSDTADVLEFTVGGDTNLQIRSGYLDITQYIRHIGDADTYFGFSAVDQFKVFVGGNENLNVQGNGVTLSYAGSSKLNTQTGGVAVTGDLITTGDVGIGVTNPTAKLQVDGDSYFEDTVSIASLSSYAYLNIIVSDAGNGNSGQGLMYLQNTNAATSGGAMVLALRNDYGVGFGNYIKFFKTGGSTIGEIYANSGRTNVVYSTSSDYRLKEDLKTFKAVDIINQIPVYDFKWKETDFRDYGVLAHEMQAVLPGLVKGDKDGEENQTVDYMAMVPILMQSIKELKAEIELLKQNK